MAVGSDGSVFVAGHHDLGIPGDPEHVFMMNVAPDGQLLWQRLLVGEGMVSGTAFPEAFCNRLKIKIKKGKKASTLLLFKKPIKFHGGKVGVPGLVRLLRVASVPERRPLVNEE